MSTIDQSVIRKYAEGLSTDELLEKFRSVSYDAKDYAAVKLVFKKQCSVWRVQFRKPKIKVPLLAGIEPKEALVNAYVWAIQNRFIQEHTPIFFQFISRTSMSQDWNEAYKKICNEAKTPMEFGERLTGLVLEGVEKKSKNLEEIGSKIKTVLIREDCENGLWYSSKSGSVFLVTDCGPLNLFVTDQRMSRDPKDYWRIVKGEFEGRVILKKHCNVG